MWGGGGGGRAGGEISGPRPPLSSSSVSTEAATSISGVHLGAEMSMLVSSSATLEFGYANRMVTFGHQ